MSQTLKGNAGTGDKILKDWNNFSYELKETENENERYYFDVKFRKQEGHMTICIKDDVINENTLIDLKGFDRPLGAYNDTTNSKEGLYAVAEKMLKELRLEPFIQG